MSIRYLFILILPFLAACAFGQQYIVQNGQPRAEIVLAEDPARAADMGAHELQTYIQKITGATLPIVSEPSGEVPVKIYVGHSQFTRDIEAPTSDDGAYRIVSGDDYLALIGHDWDFTPIGPWARSRGDWQNNVLSQWREMTDSYWYNPIASRIYRDYNGSVSQFDPDGPRDTSDGKTGLWEFDKRGSQNAVYGYLRSLGVRWYMPGELGEIVPQMDSIELPQIDQTVSPDHRWRYPNYARYGRDDQASIVWAMRQYGNNFYGELLSHGMRDITNPQELKDAHPEYYALYSGERNTVQHKANQCLRSPGLFEETVRYIRALYDIHDVRMVSVMPSDGYTSACQCELCEGADTLDRGRDGWISDYVWDFTNRVAQEVYKTHPDRYISNFAYGTYKLPPLKIDKLSPNVVVGIVGGRQSFDRDPEVAEELEALRQAWAEKTANPLITWINYPQMRRGEFRPVYWPMATAESIKRASAVSQGEFSWLPENRGLDTPGVTHLSAWMYHQMLWDVDQDPQALLDEYFQLFYGPAAEEMAAFVAHSEAHFTEMRSKKAPGQKALELFEQAKQKVDPNSVYGQRLALIDEYLEGMRKKVPEMERPRGPVPVLEIADRSDQLASFTLDGKLDDGFWQDIPATSRGVLKNNLTGEAADFPANFKIAWADGKLYLAIHCQDEAGQPANIGTEEDHHPGIFYGDTIEVLIETDEHSYYQIVLNPAGAINDLNRGNPKNSWYEWKSQTELEAQVGNDYWTIEAVIPVDQDSDDPNHVVAGKKPTEANPWHINICRQRMRNNEPAYSCWSVSKSKGFHDVMKFGKVYVK